MKRIFRANASGALAAAVVMLSACATPSPAPAPTKAVVPTTVATKAPAFQATIDGITGELMPGKNLTVVGWAMDTNNGGPVPRVELIVDGRWTVAATVGDERPDVVKLLNRQDALKTGWVAQFNTNDLAVGKHTLGLLVFDYNNQPILMDMVYPFELAAPKASAAPAQVAVAPTNAPAPTSTPAISGGYALTGQLESTEGTARPSWQLILKGWAASLDAKVPISRVEFELDGEKIGQVVPSLAREDLAARLKGEGLKPGYLFRANIPATKEPGSYVLRSILVGGDGITATGNAIEIVVLPGLPTVAPPKPTLAPEQPKEPAKAPEVKPTDALKEPAKPTAAPTPKP